MLLLVLAPVPAAAHAVLVEAAPARNEVLPEPPAQIRLLFNEPVTADFNPIAVYNSRGERVDRGNGRVTHGNLRLVVADLPALPDGLYSVTYRVTSADGHVVSDTFAFTVGPPLASSTDKDEAAKVPRVPPAVGLTRGVMQAAALGLAGLTAFYVAVWPRSRSHTDGTDGDHAERVVRWLWGLALLLAASSLLDLAIYAVRASGEPLSAGLLWTALSRARAGRFFWARLGLSLLTAVCAQAATALMQRGAHAAAGKRGRLLWWAALALGLLTLMPLTGQSHAAATGRSMPLLADWLHMAAIAPWAGGLLGFVVLWPRRPGGRSGVPLSAVVSRFSRLAIVSVLVMGLTGLYAALLHVPDWNALLTTGYGRTLVLKLALLMPVLALGAVNLIRQGRGPFRRLVAAELLLVIAIVAVTGFLSSMPPAEAEAGLTAGPFSATQKVGEVSVTLHIDPAKYGYNKGIVTLTDAAGAPVTGASVGLRLSMPGHDMGPQNPEAVEQAPGEYVIEQIVFGMAGPWDVEVAILTAGGRELRTTFRLRVPTPL